MKIPRPTPDPASRPARDRGLARALTGRKRRGTGAGGAIVAAVLVTTGLAGCGDDGDADNETSGAADDARRAEVAERGAEVMPFDLDATVHQFEPTDDGLIQRVTAHDPADTTQVELVEEHLREEADRFAEGDYGDPAQIHGEDMPGLAALEAGADDLAIIFEEIPGGAMLTYTTEVPELVEALHDWADAQVDDHGDHAH